MASNSNVSPQNWVAALLLCIFLGVFGVHRFYVGKIGTGILMLLTGGVFGILWIIDIIMIAIGSFTDRNGQFVKP
jgi:TM2 domain-containing membrane protein YozV